MTETIFDKDLADVKATAEGQPFPAFRSGVSLALGGERSSLEADGDLAVGRRPLFLRPYFNDCYVAFPSLDGRRFILIGRAEDRRAWLIDVYDALGRRIEKEFVARSQEIFRCGGER